MLPSGKQSREGSNVTPANARVMLVGTPGAGKTTLASTWNPEHTLLIDTQGGTKLLDGEHYVTHISTWQDFISTVTELTTTEHDYQTVVIDMVDDLWNFCDVAFAGKGQVLASATDDWQRSIKTAEGTFRQEVGKLLATSLGVWFTSHANERLEGQITRYSSKLDKRVLTYVQGATQFVWLAETLGPKRQLHTAPTARFEAKSRVPLPEPMEMDARKLWAAMDAGLNPKKMEAVAA